MRYTGAYALLLVLHLLTVAFVVGPAALAAMSSARLARTGQVAALRSASATTRNYTLATLVTVVLGSAMVGLGNVGDQWKMSQAWISTSYVLALVALLLMLLLVVPAQEKAAQAIEQHGDAGSFLGRISAGAGLATLAWIAVIVLMVTKPGA